MAGTVGGGEGQREGFHFMTRSEKGSSGWAVCRFVEALQKGEMRMRDGHVGCLAGARNLKMKPCFFGKK